jgi:hypothetical protein
MIEGRIVCVGHEYNHNEICQRKNSFFPVSEAVIRAVCCGKPGEGEVSDNGGADLPDCVRGRNQV